MLHRWQAVTLVPQKYYLDVTQVSLNVTQVANSNLGATKISLICYTCVIECRTGGKR